jgi:hypothetical protein
VKKITENFEKSSSVSRTIQPNSIELGTYYPWVNGIEVCTNKGPGFLQRGENHKNAKIGWCALKIVCSRTTMPDKLKLT